MIEGTCQCLVWLWLSLLVTIIILMYKVSNYFSDEEYNASVDVNGIS